MSQPDAVQQATDRLDAAVDKLEDRLQQAFAAEDGDVSTAALKQELRYLTEERDQLLADLEAERNRVRRLKAANDEVSGRLESVMGTIRGMMPAV
jgi:chromosome segregation ATPase